VKIDALRGAVVELGGMTGHAMPVCEAVLALVTGTGAAGRML
jgi:ketopantoate reductase